VDAAAAVASAGAAGAATAGAAAGALVAAALASFAATGALLAPTWSVAVGLFEVIEFVGHALVVPDALPSVLVWVMAYCWEASVPISANMNNFSFISSWYFICVLIHCLLGLKMVPIHCLFSFIPIVFDLVIDRKI
jgi:hypothetical protein